MQEDGGAIGDKNK